MGYTVAVCPAARKEASLLRTSDGGRSWHLLPLGLGPEVTCSFGCGMPDPIFVDNRNGFIDTGRLGGSGWLLVTADAGRTWSVRPKPPAFSGWIDAHSGWAWRQFRATGAAGAMPAPQPVFLYVTDDGGLTWQEAQNNLDGQVNQLYFVDQRDGFAVIETTFGMQLASTTDGGTHWSVVGAITAT
jgi:photosystem II stability/assembly factor-like uncharacterized protein